MGHEINLEHSSHHFRTLYFSAEIDIIPASRPERSSSSGLVGHGRTNGGQQPLGTGGHSGQSGHGGTMTREELVSQSPFHISRRKSSQDQTSPEKGIVPA